MEVAAQREQHAVAKHSVGVQVLRVHSFLQARIVLSGFRRRGLGHKESEVRVEIEQRPREKSIHLEDVTGGQIPAVVDTESGSFTQSCPFLCSLVTLFTAYQCE